MAYKQESIKKMLETMSETMRKYGRVSLDRIREKGKQTKRWKANVSFGVARYYYDYSF